MNYPIILRRALYPFYLFILSILLSCGAPPPPPPPPPPPVSIVPSPEELKAQAEAKAKEQAEEEAAQAAEAELKQAQAEQEKAIALKESHQLLLEAREKMIKEDLDAANALYVRVTERTPEIPEAHYNLGVLAERSGLPQVARDHYKRALSAQVDFTPAMLALVRFSLRAQDAQSALNMINRKLSEDPENIAYLNAKCSILNILGEQRSEVQNLAKQVLRKDEQNVPAMINLASTFEAEGKHELAIAILENAKSLDTTNPEVYARIARSQIALGDTLNARFTLEAAVKLPEGSSAEIHNQLGLIYLRAGDYPSSEAQFKRSLLLWPQMIEAQVNLGNALKGQQRFSEASDAFTQALAMKPSFPPALFNLGILYLDGRFDDLNKIEQLNKALEYFKIFQSTSPSQEDAEQIERFIKECERLIEIQKKLLEQATQPSADPPPEDTLEGVPQVQEPNLDSSQKLDENRKRESTEESDPQTNPVETPLVDDTIAPTQPESLEDTKEDGEDEEDLEIEELDLEKASPKKEESKQPSSAPKSTPNEESEPELEIEEVEL